MLSRAIPGFVLLFGTTGCGSVTSRYCENLHESEQRVPTICPDMESEDLVDLKTCREILNSACKPPEVEILQQRLDCASLVTICGENDEALACLDELRETVGEPDDECESAQDLLFL